VQSRSGPDVRQSIDPAQATEYPANIQAILKRQAPCSAWLNQALLEIDKENGFAKISYELGEAHFNRFGALHGGAIACVMDDVLAVAAGLVLPWGEIAPTLEMKVSYLSQGTAGRHIAEARVIKRGKQINFLEAALANPDGKLIATSTATIMIAAMKKP
jgi:acyl-coenzyme A thioesterase 13